MYEDEKFAQVFYDELEGGGLGTLSFVGRMVFDISGFFYVGNLLRHCRLRSSHRVLEIGCGAASILTRAYSVNGSNKTYFGIDISPVMLDRARQNIQKKGLNDRIFLVESPASTLPFKSQSFDLVFLAYVIKHLSDESLASCLREAYRVLIPGGNLALWEFLPSPISWINRYIYAITRAQKLRTLPEVLSFLGDGGFPVARSFTVIAPWLPTKTLALVAGENRS
ncbi:MAG TPA: class I SAM-dependent methyltransferase [Candidatus Hypogeohydataceae bacterium YC41]